MASICNSAMTNAGIRFEPLNQICWQILIVLPVASKLRYKSNFGRQLFELSFVQSLFYSQHSAFGLDELSKPHIPPYSMFNHLLQSICSTDAEQYDVYIEPLVSKTAICM